MVEDKKIARKGIESVRRDWCRLVGVTLDRVLELLLRRGDPRAAVECAFGAVQRLRDMDVDMGLLVISQGLSKQVDDYKGAAASKAHLNVARKRQRRDGVSAPVGERIDYVILAGTKKDKLGELGEDPLFALSNQLPISTQDYIDRQLQGPLSRVLAPVFVASARRQRPNAKRTIEDFFAPDAKRSKPDDGGGDEAEAADKEVAKLFATSSSTVHLPDGSTLELRPRLTHSQSGISAHFVRAFRCLRCNVTMPVGGESAPSHCFDCLNAMAAQDSTGLRVAAAEMVAEMHEAERGAVAEHRARYDRCRSCQKKPAAPCPHCAGVVLWDECTRCGAAVEPTALDECVTRSCDNYYLRVSSGTKRERVRHLTVRYEETARLVEQNTMCSEDLRW